MGRKWISWNIYIFLITDICLVHTSEPKMYLISNFL